jgi:hypothetical protein
MGRRWITLVSAGVLPVVCAVPPSATKNFPCNPSHLAPWRSCHVVITLFFTLLRRRSALLDYAQPQLAKSNPVKASALALEAMNNRCKLDPSTGELPKTRNRLQYCCARLPH